MRVAKHSFAERIIVTDCVVRSRGVYVRVAEVEAVASTLGQGEFYKAPGG